MFQKMIRQIGKQIVCVGIEESSTDFVITDLPTRVYIVKTKTGEYKMSIPADCSLAFPSNSYLN